MDESYQEYIDRLIDCGYSPCTAFFTYHSFLKESSLKDLDDFLRSLEEEKQPCG